MAARLSGQHVGKESGETGTERGGPILSSGPTMTTSQDEAEREVDGALGVPGGQPDVSPSGPDNNNDTPEPKVKRII